MESQEKNGKIEKENRTQREFLRARSKTRYDPGRMISLEREDRRPGALFGSTLKRGSEKKSIVTYEPPMLSLTKTGTCIVR